MKLERNIGARYLGQGRCEFVVWAPEAEKLDMVIVGQPHRHALTKDAEGYFSVELSDVAPGTRYWFSFDQDKHYPDPASHYQPLGVHGPSEVVDHSFSWTDGAWNGTLLKNYVIYEIHVGAFTRPGTFEAAAAHLDYLSDLGVTAIELMPLAQFPGDRNWGYDGVFPYAVHQSYGGPEGLKRFVNACHERGISVMLDVVYNHLGPEGNCLGAFGPYFTDKYQTPWGRAINYDGHLSGGVRNYFLRNAMHWIENYHVDAFRLDSVYAMYDHSGTHVLSELADVVHDTGRRLNRAAHVIVETNENAPYLLQPAGEGGYGLDGQWMSDFHHAVHSYLTGERTGYYHEFGKLPDIARAFEEGYVFSSRSQEGGRRSSSKGVRSDQVVVAIQNHDEVGNRCFGERLGQLVPFEAQKLAASLAIFSPYLPFLFMGQEYDETAPFQYFIHHSDESLIAAVREGRKREFSGFQWRTEPPDPQDLTTFLRCKLNHNLRESGRHQKLREFYREIIRLSKRLKKSGLLSRENMTLKFSQDEKWLTLRYGHSDGIWMGFNFRTDFGNLRFPERGHWFKVLDSADGCWNGSGSQIPKQVDGGSSLSLGPQSVLILGNKEI